METKYYIMATLVSLIFLLLLLSACRTHHTYTTPDGIQVELPRTPADQEGGAR